MSEYNIGDKVYLECEVVNKDNTYKLKYRACYDDEYTYVKDNVLHTMDELYSRGTCENFWHNGIHT